MTNFQYTINHEQYVVVSVHLFLWVLAIHLLVPTQ